jgi:hypothetical protein
MKPGIVPGLMEETLFFEPLPAERGLDFAGTATPSCRTTPGKYSHRPMLAPLSSASLHAVSC